MKKHKFKFKFNKKWFFSAGMLATMIGSFAMASCGPVGNISDSSIAEYLRQLQLKDEKILDTNVELQIQKPSFRRFIILQSQNSYQNSANDFLKNDDSLKKANSPLVQFSQAMDNSLEIGDVTKINDSSKIDMKNLLKNNLGSNYNTLKTESDKKTKELTDLLDKYANVSVETQEIKNIIENARTSLENLKKEISPSNGSISSEDWIEYLKKFNAPKTSFVTTEQDPSSTLPTTMPNPNWMNDFIQLKTTIKKGYDYNIDDFQSSLFKNFSDTKDEVLNAYKIIDSKIQPLIDKFYELFLKIRSHLQVIQNLKAYTTNFALKKASSDYIKSNSNNKPFVTVLTEAIKALEAYFADENGGLLISINDIGFGGISYQSSNARLSKAIVSLKNNYERFKQNIASIVFDYELLSNNSDFFSNLQTLLANNGISDIQQFRRINNALANKGSLAIYNTGFLTLEDIFYRKFYNTLESEEIGLGALLDDQDTAFMNSIISNFEKADSDNLVSDTTLLDTRFLESISFSIADLIYLLDKTKDSIKDEHKSLSAMVNNSTTSTTFNIDNILSSLKSNWNVLLENVHTMKNISSDLHFGGKNKSLSKLVEDSKKISDVITFANQENSTNILNIFLTADIFDLKNAFDKTFGDEKTSFSYFSVVGNRRNLNSTSVQNTKLFDDMEKLMFYTILLKEKIRSNTETEKAKNKVNLFAIISDKLVKPNLSDSNIVLGSSNLNNLDSYVKNVNNVFHHYYMGAFGQLIDGNDKIIENGVGVVTNTKEKSTLSYLYLSYNELIDFIPKLKNIFNSYAPYDGFRTITNLNRQWINLANSKIEL